jgi:hypothetical protein
VRFIHDPSSFSCPPRAARPHSRTTSLREMAPARTALVLVAILALSIPARAAAKVRGGARGAWERGAGAPAAVAGRVTTGPNARPPRRRAFLPRRPRGTAASPSTPPA